MPNVLSAIVVNYRRPEMTLACLAALRTSLERIDAATEIVVVDNGSGDDSCERIRAEAGDVELIALPENLGFPSGAAEGIRHSDGEWIALINNDVIVEPDALPAMLAAGRGAADVGSIAAQMRFADDPTVINSAGIGVDRLGIAFDRLLGQPAEAGEDEPIEVFGACGGAALHRRAMLDAVNGMDETYFFALDDADLSWRAQMAGWRCLYVPDAVVHHHHGATTAHGSDLKYFHVGLNRVRTLAKNATTRQLLRHGAAMAAYDAAYVAYAALTDRSLAPLRGRLRGLREWRAYREAGRAGRRPVELEPVRGVAAALRRRAVWAAHSGGQAGNGSGSGHGRTLFVFHHGGINGPGFSLLPVARELARNGGIECLVPDEGWVARRYRELGPVAVADYGALTYARSPAGAARLALRLAREVLMFWREVSRRRPERVIVATTAVPAAVLAARLSRRTTMVVAAEIQDLPRPGSPLRRPWAQLLIAATARLADAVVCCSATVAKQFRPGTGTPVAVAYPPVASPIGEGDRERGRARYGLEREDLCVVTIGSLTHGRGQDVAIRALARLLPRFPHARLLLVGEPHPRAVDIEFAEGLPRLAAELGVADAVIFGGPTEAIADVYAAADVVVNPVRTPEGFGRTGAEAMVARRPIVASRVGALEEVVSDGETGLLVDPDDPDALADAVTRVLDDSELRERLVAAARRDAVERFSGEANLAVWAETLELVETVRTPRGR